MAHRRSRLVATIFILLGSALTWRESRATACALGCQPPGEAQNVLKPTKPLLTWNPPLSSGSLGVRYDVLRSTRRDDFTSPAFATCLATDISALSLADAATPVSGQVFYYLIRAKNGCGEGSLGFGDPGLVERVGQVCNGLPLNAGYEPPGDDDGEVDDGPSLPCVKNTGGVHLHSGEYTLTQTDLRIPGRGFDFVWSRTYRSRQERLTDMGYNWDYSYNLKVEINGSIPSERWLYDGAGRRDTYTPIGGNCWTALGFFRELCLEAGGAYTLTFPDMTVWTFKPLDGSPAAGKIEEMRDRNQNTMTFAYDGLGRLASVTDTLSRTISIHRDAQGLIDRLDDFAGRQVRYQHYLGTEPGGSAGDLAAWITPAVTGTPTGNDFPLGKSTVYTYAKGLALAELNHNLLTVTDPLGQLIVQNSYTPTRSPLDRIAAQQIAGSDIVNYVYVAEVPSAANHFATMRVIVNDRAGNVREIFFDASNNEVIVDQLTGRSPEPTCPTDDVTNRPGAPLRPGDPPRYEDVYQYNANFQVTRIDRPNGGSIVYTYEADLNPGGPRRSAGNLREIKRLPGPLGGDQAQIVQSFTYEPSFNQLTQEIDGRGNAAVHGYDAAGNRTHTQHRIPTIVEDWEYNAFGQLTAHVLPDNGSGHRRRDEVAYYTSGPQRGYTQTETMDAGGLAYTTTYAYDAAGNVVSKIDRRGRDTLYTVNQLDQPVQERSREVSPGGVRYLKNTYYDAANRPVQEDLENRDETGGLQANAFLTSTSQFDALDLRTRRDIELDPGSTIAEEYDYDANDHLLLVRSGEAVGGAQPANTATSLSDERDLPFREVRAAGDPDQSTTQTDYDANGNVTALRQGLENAPRVTLTAYDGYDRPVSRTDAMGNVTTWHYDANGNVVSERVDGQLQDVPGSAGNVRLKETSYQYDAMDRRFRADVQFFDSVTQAPIGDGQSTTQTFFAGTGDVVRIVDDNGGETRMAYDRANRRSLFTDARGNTIAYLHDGNGNVVTKTETEKSDLGGADQVFVTQYVYDGLDRLIQETDNVGNTRHHAYDSRGNRVKTVDASSQETRTTFDGADREKQTAVDMNGTGADVVDPGDIVTGVTWDLSSRATGETDDNGHTTAPEYDALDREVSEDMADCTEPGGSYDVHGNETGSTDARGSVETLTYDLLNRVTHRTIVPGPGVGSDTTFEDYRYDGLSRLVRAENDDTVVTRRYDSLGQVTEETQSLTGGGPPATIAAVHDGMGNRTQITYPGGRTVTTTYDALNRKKTIADQGGAIATYDYLGFGRVARRTLGNGTRTDWQYDGIANAPGDFGVRQVVRTTHTAIGGGTVLDDRTYLWDREGNKTRRKDVRAAGPQYTHDYTYDAADRLVHTTILNAASVPVRDTGYALDGVGNRLAVTGSGALDAGSYTEVTGCPVADHEMNQYTTTPVSARTYDDAGNLTAVSGLASVKYDVADRMVEFHDLATGKRHTYAYDALGRRVLKIENADAAGGPAVPTRFLLDGWQEIEESDLAGASLATHVLGNYVDEVLTTRRAGVDRFFHGDDLFSVMAVTDDTGAVIERYEFDDFGRPLDPLLLSPTSSPSLVGNPWLFTGRSYDAESGLYYYRTRYLDPRAGRFTTRDRIGNWGDPQSIGNGYAYVGNNPLSRTDPTGMGEDGLAKIPDRDKELTYQGIFAQKLPKKDEDDLFRLYYRRQRALKAAGSVAARVGFDENFDFEDVRAYLMALLQPEWDEKGAPYKVRNSAIRLLQELHRNVETTLARMEKDKKGLGWTLEDALVVLSVEGITLRDKDTGKAAVAAKIVIKESKETFYIVPSRDPGPPMNRPYAIGASIPKQYEIVNPVHPSRPRGCAGGCVPR